MPSTSSESPIVAVVPTESESLATTLPEITENPAAVNWPVTFRSPLTPASPCTESLSLNCVASTTVNVELSVVASVTLIVPVTSTSPANTPAPPTLSSLHVTLDPELNGPETSKLLTESLNSPPPSMMTFPPTDSVFAPEISKCCTYALPMLKFAAVISPVATRSPVTDTFPATSTGATIELRDNVPHTADAVDSVAVSSTPSCAENK